jgi:TupA-like ATPgrasp
LLVSDEDVWSYAMNERIKDLVANHVFLYRPIMFYKYHGRLPNLIRPKLFNDKIAWRITFDRRDFISASCDKLQTKEQIRITCPEVSIPETLAVFMELSEMRNFDLTGDWVLKEIAGTGQVYFGHGNPTPDECAEIAELLDVWKVKSDRLRKREWSYRNLSRGYLIERRISSEELADFKFHTFDGVVRFMSFNNGRKDGFRHAIYSPEGDLLPIQWGPQLPDNLEPLPDTFQVMREYAQKIGQGIDYMRIDFYSHENEIYFGELTPCVGAGMARMEPREYELLFGSYWKLPSWKEVRRRRS